MAVLPVVVSLYKSYRPFRAICFHDVRLAVLLTDWMHTFHACCSIIASWWFSFALAGSN